MLLGVWWWILDTCCGFVFDILWCYWIKNMWEIIKDILKKKACFHDWKLVKETEMGYNKQYKHFIYICQKCGEIKEINIKF